MKVCFEMKVLILESSGFLCLWRATDGGIRCCKKCDEEKLQN